MDTAGKEGFFGGGKFMVRLCEFCRESSVWGEFLHHFELLDFRWVNGFFPPFGIGIPILDLCV